MTGKAVQVRAMQAATMREGGMLVREIADALGCSTQRVFQLCRIARIMRDGPPVPVPPSDERPPWSYPDEITKRIVREAKAAMERGE